MTLDDRNKPVYTIGIASAILSIHPQTLRTYERLGFINPHRTKGQTRLYSEQNIERIRFIQDLTRQKHVNLAGVEIILELQLQIEHLREETKHLVEEIRRQIKEQTRGMPDRVSKSETPSSHPVIRIKVEKG